MSEPTQMTSAEKRKVDETAKELRAPLPITAPPYASSLRSDDETHGQLTRSAKQVRTTKTEIEALQDVSFLLQKDHCEHQRHGFLQVRMAGMRKSIRKELLKKKDGEKNLHFTSCPLASCSQRKETHRMEKADEFQCQSCFERR